ncbi:unnamed protein product [Prorocentrum cordatum]|uniref:Uncharacterized protein n=1 Tax=Prorocentrum cordatum TaxID=2364126 RepID=A0ABN9U5B3_9DINO|nr:unnamed protein product [Polarella glacialis]
MDQTSTSMWHTRQQRRHEAARRDFEHVCFRLQVMESSLQLLIFRVEAFSDKVGGLEKQGSPSCDRHDLADAPTRLSRSELLLFRSPLTEFQKLGSMIEHLLPQAVPSNHIREHRVPKFEATPEHKVHGAPDQPEYERSPDNNNHPRGTDDIAEANPRSDQLSVELDFDAAQIETSKGDIHGRASRAEMSDKGERAENVTKAAEEIGDEEDKEESNVTEDGK